LKENKLEDLEFLREFDFIKYLALTTELQDFNFLNSLIHLKWLSLGQNSPKIEINFSKNKGLEYLQLEWKKNKIIGLEHCKNLKKMIIWSFNVSSLAPLKGLNNLEELEIKTGSMKTLDGIAEYPNLKKLNLGNCNYLTSIKAINSLKNLEELWLHACSKVADYESLLEFPNLKFVWIKGAKKVSTIRFLKKSTKLNFLSIGYNTEILDKDLSFLNLIRPNECSIEPFPNQIKI
jgi:Leucine-rich repeat (LRR) protein